jgi:hypothetical protein
MTKRSPARSIETTSRAERKSLGMPLDNVIGEVIAALKSDAERLGLPGGAS